MKAFKVFVFLLLLVHFLPGCKISETKIAGIYFDKVTSDTLSLFPDKTFGYVEKLANNELGWNTGSWSFKNGFVSFFNTKPLPIVGYWLQRKIEDSISEALQLKFLLKDSKKLLTIKRVVVLLNNKPVAENSFNVSANLLTFKNFNFDSLSVTTAYFPPISFNVNSFKKNHLYQIVISPAERLFELDKSSYKYKNRKLINKAARIRFKKTGKEAN